MKNHARVVVIGGGIAGASTIYHLTKLGWSDVVLVDKDELTSGSTWMAAGNVPQYSVGYSLTRVHDYPTKLYPTLEEETGQHTGWHTCGSLRIAMDPERMLEYKHVVEKDNTLGINSYLVSPSELKDIYPYIDPTGVLGGIFHPDDGHVDPAGVTQAMVKGAKMRGAEVERFNQVEDISRTPNGEWIVHTKKGTITCEHIVNCAGLWAKEIAAMVGVELPIVAIEHQHILFGEVAELTESGINLPLLRDPDTSYYMRQEMDGLLIGPYEPTPQPWHPDGVPWDYASQTLPTNLERIQDILMAAIGRVPILNNVGVKHEVNGPITYSPDGVALCGPAFGVPNFFINAGHCFGVTECATYGKYAAEWLIEGEASVDMSFADPRRFGDYANYNYTLNKVDQTYRMMYAIEFPWEERPAARNIKTTPIYDILKQRGAAFGQTYGWERAAWFAPEGVEPVDEYTYKRGNWHQYLTDECKAVRERIGVLDLSGFTKIKASGSGAESFLNYICTNSMPKKIGKIKVCPMVDRNGHFKVDATVTKICDDCYYIVVAAATERHDLDWIQKLAPCDGSVTIENVTNNYGTLVLAGPKTRDLMVKLTDTDMSNKAFPFLTSQKILMGNSDVLAMRIGFVGELGWEIHAPIENIRSIYNMIIEAGEEFGIADFGLRSMICLRLEKGYCILGAELNGERSPMEAGLDRFVDFNKGDFIGRQALIDQKENGTVETLVLMEIDADDADCIGDEPIYQDGKIVGRVASGGYGHYVDKSLATGYVAVNVSAEGTKLEIPIFGDRRQATVVTIPFYDPKNERLRG